MMAWVITEGFHQLKKIMSEIMDDFDAGKKFEQNKVLELIDEVIEAYENLRIEGYDESMQFKVRALGSQGRQISEKKAQINAVKFMKDWVLSGGHEDEDGNRVCLVW